MNPDDDPHSARDQREGAGPADQDDEPAPPFGSWRRLYALVIAWLAALIALFYAFTKAFS